MKKIIYMMGFLSIVGVSSLVIATRAIFIQRSPQGITTAHASSARNFMRCTTTETGEKLCYIRDERCAWPSKGPGCRKVVSLQTVDDAQGTPAFDEYSEYSTEYSENTAYSTDYPRFGRDAHYGRRAQKAKKDYGHHIYDNSWTNWNLMRSPARSHEKPASLGYGRQVAYTTLPLAHADDMFNGFMNLQEVIRDSAT